MDLRFRKSKRCEALNQEGCVELAAGPGFVAVRDSQDPHGGELRVSPADWRRFVAELRDGK